MSAILAMQGRVSLFSDRDAWLRHRATACDGTGIGASEVAAVLGHSPHRGPWDVWTARQRGEVADDPDDVLEEGEEPPEIDPTEIGQDLEPVVRRWAGRLLRRPVLGPAEPFGDADIAIVSAAAAPWALASVDSWVVEEDPAIVPCELKTDASPGCHRKWGRSGTVVGPGDDIEATIRLDYGIQLAWQIGVTGATHGYLVAFVGGRPPRWYRYEPDPRVFPQLLRLVGAWRDRHLVRGEEPDRDASDACVAFYREKFAGPKQGSRRATAEEAEWIGAIVAGKKAAEEANAAKANLLASMGTLSSLWIGEGCGVRLNKRGSLTPYGF
jgi:hypothetical protein